MSFRAAVAALAALLMVFIAAFGVVVRQLSFVTLGLAAHDQVEQQLRHALEDQKTLARLDPGSAPRYRERFDSIGTLLGHLRVVALSRDEMTRRIELVLLAAIALILFGGGAAYVIARRSRELRLTRLESALDALSRGETDIVVGDHRRDVIGRIAGYIEQHSSIAANNYRRLRNLEHLSSWQEAARRHAHEIRTPLTAARMEIDRLFKAAQRQSGDAGEEIAEARASILEELDRLRDFTKHFTSFAMIGKPQLRRLDLGKIVTDFCATFASAWPNVTLAMDNDCAADCIVAVDNEMLRQVLMNLCTNSAMATEGRPCSVVFRIWRNRASIMLDVSDDGPGIAPHIRGRLFEPYVTTRGIGEGLGLGLAISKKILLDHGGDLDLVPTTRGATFRLTLPESPP